MRRNFDRGVHTAASRSTNQERNFVVAEMGVLLHLSGHILHLFQTRRDQTAETHNVGVFFFGFGQNFVARHHHAHIHHFKVIALQNHCHDVFADVVHIAFDGGDDDFAFGFDIAARVLQGFFLGFNIGQQMRHRLLHHAGRFHHLWQEHFALAKQIANHIHAIHQRAFDHMQRPAALSQYGLVSLFRVFDNKFSDAMHQRMRQARIHGHRLLGRTAPFELFAVVFGRAFGIFCHFDQALARIGAAVQHHIFHALAQLRL